MSYVVLAISVLLALLGWASIATPRSGSPLWAATMSASEVSGPLLIVSGGLLGGSLAGDWAGGWPGVAAHVMLGVAIASFTGALIGGFRARGAVADAVRAFTGTDSRVRRPGPASVLVPLPLRPSGVRVDSGIAYGVHERHVLDHIHAGADDRAPAFVHIHGGGWWRGRRDTQARPLLYRLAREGWRVFTPSYRLSPEATFPDHLEDVMRAVRWIRSHAGELGVDPDLIVLSGGSTGGNLAALAALHAPEIAGCVPLYGVHELLDEFGEPLWPYLATTVMKSDPGEDPEAWRRASPIRMADADRPPFLVVHGARDTLVDPGLSRRLVASLRDGGGPAAVLMEVPKANHGFDFFAGPRGRLLAEGVAVALEHLRADRSAPGER